MVSDADNAIALGNAATYASITLGLDGIPSSDWSQDDRLAYIQLLAQSIASDPNSFNQQSLDNANRILNANLGGLQLGNYFSDSPDGSASLPKVFVDSLYDNVMNEASSLASIGTGATSILNRAGTILNNAGVTAENLSAAAAKGAGTVNSAIVIGAVLIGVLVLTVTSGAREARRAFSR